MDPIWLNRDRADREVKGVDERKVKYDPDLGVYCYHGEPFTGVSIQRYSDGSLDSLVHLVDGVAHGVTVSWRLNGQIALYREMAHDVRHGLSIEWAEDGTKLSEANYHDGRLVRYT